MNYCAVHNTHYPSGRHVECPVCSEIAALRADLDRLTKGTWSKEIARLSAANAALRAEHLRVVMQLVACGVVARANTTETAARARDMHPDFNCAAVQDVAEAVDREMALRAENEALRRDAERYLWLRDVGDETWKPLIERARRAFPHVPLQEVPSMVDEILNGAIERERSGK
jgi:hypothetical protein